MSWDSRGFLCSKRSRDDRVLGLFSDLEVRASRSFMKDSSTWQDFRINCLMGEKSLGLGLLGLGKGLEPLVWMEGWRLDHLCLRHLTQEEEGSVWPT